MTDKNHKDKAAESGTEHRHDHRHGKPADPAAVEAPPAPVAADPEPDAAAAADAPPAKPTEAEQIALLTQQLAEAADKILRLRAEMDNFRKRKIRELEDARTNAMLATLEEILPIMDQFQMAMLAIRSGNDVASVKQGMDMILTAFNRCFANLGVATLATVGGTFDPTIHEAVSTEHSATVPAGKIIREWKAGYQLGDRLLRPAVVVVSDGPAPTLATPPPTGGTAAAAPNTAPADDAEVAAED